MAQQPLRVYCTLLARWAEQRRNRRGQREGAGDLEAVLARKRCGAVLCGDPQRLLLRNGILCVIQRHLRGSKQGKGGGGGGHVARQGLKSLAVIHASNTHTHSGTEGVCIEGMD